MRVTHVITRLIIGGAQENTLASVLGLRRKPGLEVNLITGPTSGPEGSLEDLCAREPELLTILPSLVRPIHPWKDVLAYRELTAIFRHQAPHVVHTHSGKAGVLGRLSAAKAGVPLIIHTIHGPSFGSFQGTAANWLFRTAEQKAARVTTHFVVVSQAMRDQYLAAGIGSRERYSHIYSGFDLEPFLAAKNDPVVRAKFGLKPDDFVIGKIARLFKLKGHDDLFAVAPEIVQKCPQAKFLLVGDGIWRKRFERKAASLGLAKHFLFTGLVPPTAIAGLIGIMDMLVHLSFREGLPRALPQALAANRPIVAYDCDGANEVCIDGVTGFLVKPGDGASLVKSILKLAESSELRRRCGEAGRKFVIERFPTERMVDDLDGLYRQLAAERNLVLEKVANHF